MKKLLGLMAAGVILAAPAFAQNGVISLTATDVADGKQTVCVNADAALTKLAGALLDITLPAGATSVVSGKPAWVTNQANNVFAGKSVFTEVNANTPGKFVIAVVGTENLAGPGVLGCIDVNVSALTAPADVTFTAEINDADSAPVAVGVNNVKIGAPVVEPDCTQVPKPAGCPEEPPTGDGCPTITGDNAGDFDIANALNAKAGDTVSLTLNAAKGGFAGTLLTITWDPTLLASNAPKGDWKAGSIFSSPFVEANLNDVAAGKAVVAIVTTSNVDAAGGPVLTFPLTVLPAATGKAAVVTVVAEPNDADSNPVTATSGSGVVQVCGGVVEPPDCVANPTDPRCPTEPGNGLGAKSGDTDKNGKVEIADVVAAIRILFGTNTDAQGKLNADLDGNGTVDLKEIRQILKKAVAGG